MAAPEILQREQDLLMFSSLFDHPKDGNVKSRGMEIEKKIEFLESLTGRVSNRRSRRWLNDRLLMELVPRLNAEEIRGLFAPPPWGDDVPRSPFCMTNVGEWDNFRNIDMDKEVDAFTDTAFKGNPAAVCLLEEERDEEWLQAVAREFNISETCYLTRLADLPNSLGVPRFRLRWFTPVAEVKLCGHATLAASHVLFVSGLVKSDMIEFSTLSGILTAKRAPDTKASDPSNLQTGNAPESFLIELDFPVVPIMEFDGAAEVTMISKSLSGASVIEIQKTTTSDDLLVLLPSGEAVVEVDPRFDEIQRCSGSGIIITGPAPAGSGFDFFSRFFCPKLGLNEDPVCGSAHCALAPYWSKKLGKCDFIAYQASPRSGVLYIHLDEKNQRVLLRGKAVVVMEGSLLV